MYAAEHEYALTPDFNNPDQFVPPLRHYIDLADLPNAAALSDWVWSQLAGRLKTVPDDFVVREPVGEYPGCPPRFREKVRYLTLGPASDMPQLDSREEMFVEHRRSKVPAIALTVEKWGMSTWNIQDAIARWLSAQLGRRIDHRDVQTSGLKDRKARTVQKVVIPGVSMTEANELPWSNISPGGRDARRGFAVKDIRPCGELLRLGAHEENRFDVRIRVPGKSRRELQEYMQPRLEWLERHDNLIPNFFHRQRLGPSQNMQEHARVLLTGDYEPQYACDPLLTNAEKFIHHLLFQPSIRDSSAVKKLRPKLAAEWQYRFPVMLEMMRSQKQYLGLEYEVVRRLADERFGASVEAVIYDLRNRLSLSIGAWQAFYWNWELQHQIQTGAIERSPRATIPMPMFGADAYEVYGRSELGRQALAQLDALNELAEPAEPYLEAFLKEHWKEFDEEVKTKRKYAPRFVAPDHRMPDPTGFSAEVVRKLFGVNCTDKLECGLPRPSREALSAAFLKRLFLVDRRGRVRKFANRRKAFTQVSDLRVQCKDGSVVIHTVLGSGSYLTSVAETLFDTESRQ